MPKRSFDFSRDILDYFLMSDKTDSYCYSEYERWGVLPVRINTEDAKYLLSVLPQNALDKDNHMGIRLRDALSLPDFTWHHAVVVNNENERSFVINETVTTHKVSEFGEFFHHPQHGAEVKRVSSQVFPNVPFVPSETIPLPDNETFMLRTRWLGNLTATFH